jgi:alpha-1,2-mannosyltransferase
VRCGEQGTRGGHDGSAKDRPPTPRPPATPRPCGSRRFSAAFRQLVGCQRQYGGSSLHRAPDYRRRTGDRALVSGRCPTQCVIRPGGILTEDVPSQVSPGGAPLLARMRSGAWLTARRVAAYRRIFLLVEVAALVALVLTARAGIDHFGHPVGTDFLSFHAAGKLAAGPDPGAVYRPAAHSAMERRIIGSDRIPYYAFFYPPVFLLLCRALAPLPYFAALAVWLGATALALALALRSILRQPGTITALLAFPATFINLGHGQNGFLSAALYAAGTLELERRPFLAGLAFGALCYKPQLAILLPVALIFGRNWRAVAGAAVSALGLAGLAALAFGPAIWGDFLALLSAARTTFAAGGVGFAKMASVTAAIRLLGGGPGLADAAQLAAILGAATVTALVWRAGGRLAPRAAVLVAGALVAAPLLLTYDLMLAAVAATWLLRDADHGGFLPWEKTLLAAVFILPLLAEPVAATVHIPLGPLAGLALLGLGLARARAAPPVAAAS